MQPQHVVTPETLSQAAATQLETLTSRRAQLLQSKGEYEKKVRDLGTLPADAFDKYRGQSVAQLNKKLAGEGRLGLRFVPLRD